MQEFLPSVKQRVSPDVPSAVSLRLSAATVERLLADESALADLRAFLSAEDLYVVTANAFPYGPFKNRLVDGDSVRAGLARPSARRVHEGRRHDPLRRSPATA